VFHLALTVRRSGQFLEEFDAILRKSGVARSSESKDRHCADRSKEPVGVTHTMKKPVDCYGVLSLDLT
jgi:hypothetical protein